MRIFSLDTAIRSMGDPQFTAFVDHIGEDSSGNRQNLALIAATTNFDDTVDFLFPPHILADAETCLDRAFLSPLNIHVDEFNDKILDQLPGDFQSYFSSDSLKEAEHAPLNAPERTPDYLTMLTHPGVPPHRLDLKQNCICAIQRNISVEKGLVRNARVRILALHRRFIEVQLLNNFESHCIPRINFSFHPGRSSWTINRKQFPLRLAYATTFNGCQGLTLSRTVLDLRTDPFAHGQLYTSLSRVRTRRDTLCLFTETNEEQNCANVVFPELLL